MILTFAIGQYIFTLSNSGWTFLANVGGEGMQLSKEDLESLETVLDKWFRERI
jgi:hypothetical protein